MTSSVVTASCSGIPYFSITGGRGKYSGAVKALPNLGYLRMMTLETFTRSTFTASATMSARKRTILGKERKEEAVSKGRVSNRKKASNCNSNGQR